MAACHALCLADGTCHAECSDGQRGSRELQEFSPHAFLISWAFWQHHEYLPILSTFTAATFLCFLFLLDVSWLAFNCKKKHRVCTFLSKIFEQQKASFYLVLKQHFHPHGVEDWCKDTSREIGLVIQALMITLTFKKYNVNRINMIVLCQSSCAS